MPGSIERRSERVRSRCNSRPASQTCRSCKLRQAAGARLLHPDHVHDFARLRIDNQDHIVEDDNLVTLKDRVDLNHPRRSIVPFDGIRNVAADPDGEVDLTLMVMMERAVVNEDAVNTDLPLVRNAGEASVFGMGAASNFVSGLAAAQALAFGPRAALTRASALLGVALGLAVLA